MSNGDYPLLFLGEGGMVDPNTGVSIAPVTNPDISGTVTNPIGGGSIPVPKGINPYTLQQIVNEYPTIDFAPLVKGMIPETRQALDIPLNPILEGVNHWVIEPLHDILVSIPPIAIGTNLIREVMSSHTTKVGERIKLTDILLPQYITPWLKEAQEKNIERDKFLSMINNSEAGKDIADWLVIGSELAAVFGLVIMTKGQAAKIGAFGAGMITTMIGNYFRNKSVVQGLDELRDILVELEATLTTNDLSRDDMDANDAKVIDEVLKNKDTTTVPTVPPDQVEKWTVTEDEFNELKTGLDEATLALEAMKLADEEYRTAMEDMVRAIAMGAASGAASGAVKHVVEVKYPEGKAPSSGGGSSGRPKLLHQAKLLKKRKKRLIPSLGSYESQGANIDYPTLI